MKAIQVQQFGTTEHLNVLEVDKPTINASQILIKASHSGVNLADTYIRKGAFPGLPTPPFTLGMEGSGTVEEIGDEVENIRIGELVAFCANETYAEYVVVDQNSVTPHEFAFPVNLDCETASAISMSARTAILLSHRLTHSEKQTVLVHAAAGSVGSILIQLLKSKGHTVIGLVGSTEKKTFIEKLGADLALNYNDADFSTTLKEAHPNGINTVYNATGGHTIARDLDILSENGHLIWYGFAQSNTAPNLEQAIQNSFMKSIKLELFNGGTTSKDENLHALKEIETLINNKQLTIPIDRVFHLTDSAKAHEHLESGLSKGKILLKV